MLFWTLLVCAVTSFIVVLVAPFASQTWLKHNLWPPLSVIFPLAFLCTLAFGGIVLGGIASYYGSMSVMSGGPTRLIDTHGDCSYESLSNSTSILSTSGMTDGRYYEKDVDRLDAALRNIKICVENTNVVKYWRSDHHPLRGAQSLPFFYREDIPEHMEEFEVFLSNE